MIGRNSGIRSIGESTHRTAMTTATLPPRYTHVGAATGAPWWRTLEDGRQILRRAGEKATGENGHQRPGRDEHAAGDENEPQHARIVLDACGQARRDRFSELLSRSLRYGDLLGSRRDWLAVAAYGHPPRSVPRHRRATLRKEPVDAGQDAAEREGEHESAAAAFRRVHHHHERHGADAVDRDRHRTSQQPLLSPFPLWSCTAIRAQIAVRLDDGVQLCFSRVPNNVGSVSSTICVEGGGVRGCTDDVSVLGSA